MGKDLLRKISILSASIIVVSGGYIAANIPKIVTYIGYKSKIIIGLIK